MSVDVAGGRLPAADTKALGVLWARSRIATLGDYQKIAPDSATQREITELGLKYHLLTDFTSFIAVDKVVRNPGGEQAGVDQPQPLPAGVSELALGEVPSTPEPEFVSMTLLAGGLAWWLRRRRTGGSNGLVSRA